MALKPFGGRPPRQWASNRRRLLLEAAEGGGADPNAQSWTFEDPADDFPYIVISDSGTTFTAATATGGFMWGESAASGGTAGEIPNTGKHMFEIELDVVDTWVAVGITPLAEGRDTGFAGQNFGAACLLWSGNARFYDGPTDADFTTVSPAPTFPSNGDLLTVAVDMDAETISFYINGVAFVEDGAWVKTTGTYQPYVKAFVADSVYKIPSTITYPVTGYSSF